MKLFLHINTKKIETVIPYVDNYLWNVGIQKYCQFLLSLLFLKVEIDKIKNMKTDFEYP